jgi:hypothetical protein
MRQTWAPKDHEQTVRMRGQAARRKGKTLAETDWQAVVLSSEAMKSCEQLRRQ